MTRSNGPHDQAPQWRQPTRAGYEQTGDGQQANWQYSEQEVDPHQAYQAQPPHPGQPAGPGGFPAVMIQLIRIVLTSRRASRR